jgi:hypothetical protein
MISFDHAVNDVANRKLSSNFKRKILIYKGNSSKKRKKL